MTDPRGEMGTDHLCRTVRVDITRSFVTDGVTYLAVCSQGQDFEGRTTEAALLAHEQAHQGGICTPGRERIGWIGDVHSGTLICNFPSCGWEEHVQSHLADGVATSHWLSHFEAALTGSSTRGDNQ